MIKLIWFFEVSDKIKLVNMNNSEMKEYVQRAWEVQLSPNYEEIFRLLENANLNGSVENAMKSARDYYDRHEQVKNYYFLIKWQHLFRLTTTSECEWTSTRSCATWLSRTSNAATISAFWQSEDRPWADWPRTGQIWTCASRCDAPTENTTKTESEFFRGKFK